MSHKVTKKLSKSCQKKSKKLSQKLSKSCQKVVQKLSKSCPKVFQKLSKSCQNVVPPTNYFGPTSRRQNHRTNTQNQNSENLREWYEESRIDKEWYRLMMNLGIRRPYATSSHLVKMTQKRTIQFSVVPRRPEN
jgi:hypothetical protein